MPRAQPPHRPAITVYTARQASTALAAAQALEIPVRLLSPPCGAASLGAEVFREIIELARADHPGADSLAVLDCGDSAGMALSALGVGIEAVRIDASDDVRAKLADIAGKLGATLDTACDEALDLSSAADPEQACRDWLEASS